MHKKITASCLAAAAMTALLSLQAGAGDFGGEVLSNSDIVSMTRANVASSTIIAKINATPNMFDTSTSSIIALQSNGVPNDVINAMMTAATTMRSTSALPPMDDARFRTELANIASGVNDAKYGALAWLQANSEQTLPALRQTLGDQRPEMRMASLIALGNMRDREALPAMRNLITDSSPMVRHATAQVLAEMNDTQAIAAAETALSRPLNDLDGYARLVGYARLTRAAGVLGRVLSSNPEAGTRVAAAWALGEIGRPGVDGRPALEKALETDPDPNVRREAVSALAKFHDERGARLLEDACRKDYEVRKVTLAAMAEYPECVGFLVGVMNLGPDQIAGDELETARASLIRLTSQDFGLDGAGWSQWFAANRPRYPSGGGMDSFPVQSGDATLRAAAIPAAPPSTSAPQVDVEAWSIVADSAAIPMAPQVDGGGRPLLPGLPGGLQFGGGSASGRSGPSPTASPLPVAPSPRDFESTTADLSRMGSGPAVPSNVPSMPLPSMQGPAAPVSGGLNADDVDSGPSLGSGTPMFRTWSAADSQPAAAPSAPPAAPMAGPPPEATAASTSEPAPALSHPLRPPSSDDAESGLPEWTDSSLSGLPGGDDSDSIFSGMSEPVAPQEPVVSSYPSAPAPSVQNETPLAGISLSLPGMEGFGEPAPEAPTDYAPADSASSFDAGDADSAAMLSPFAGGEEGQDATYYYDGNFEEMTGVPPAGADDDLFTAPDPGTAGTTDGVFEGVGDAVPYAESGLPGADIFDAPADPSSPFSGLDDAFTYQPLPGDDAAQPVPATPPFGDMPPPPSSGDDSSLSSGPSLGGGLFGVPPTDASPQAGDSVDFSLPPTAPEPSSEWESQSQGQYFEGMDMGYDASVPEYAAPEGQGAETFVGEPFPASAVEQASTPAPVVTTPETYVPAVDLAVEPPSPPPVDPSADPFTNPSAPMPPVKPEGTITAPAGKELPLLGEGMFKR